MRIRKVLVAAFVPLAMLTFTACPAQEGCFDDGERVSCNYDDDDDDRDDDDRYEEDDD